MSFLKVIWSVSLLRYGISIIIAFPLALAVIGFASVIVGYITNLVKNYKLRSVLCIILSVISTAACMKYSYIVLCNVVCILVYVVVLQKEEKKANNKVVSGEYVYAEDYFSNSCCMWGWGFLTAALLPLLLILHILLCEKYGIDQMSWLKFYWAFESGWLKYIVLRFVLFGCAVLMPLGLLSVFSGFNGYLIEVSQIKKNKEREIQDFKDKVSQINPDAFTYKNHAEVQMENETVEKPEQEDKAAVEDEVLGQIKKYI